MNISKETKKILTDNGLDFKIIKSPLLANVPMPDGTSKEVETDYFGLYNDKSGQIINSVKGSYHVSQNDEIVEMVLRGASKFGELSVQKAASIHDGRRVAIQLGIEGLSRVANDDIKRYITIIDSNDGSAGLSVGVGDFTMSCENQFFYFRKNNQMKFRHTATIEEKIKHLPQYIEMALSDSMRLLELYNKFESTPVTKKLADDMVKYLVGFDRKTADDKSTRAVNAMEKLYEHITKEMNQKGKNLWGLHSGVTSWTTHDKSAPQRENGRLESVLQGTNYRTNQKSLEFSQKVLTGDIITA